MRINTLGAMGSVDLCPNNRAMKANMGDADRVLRLILAASLVGLYFSGTVTGNAGIVLIVLAVVFALTSFLSFCPLYTVFGWRTRRE